MRKRASRKNTERALMGTVTVGEIMADAMKDPNTVKLMEEIKRLLPLASSSKVSHDRFRLLVLDNMKSWESWFAKVPQRHRRAAITVFIDRLVPMINEFQLALQCLNPERRIL